jgi:putative DNA primase/helicase
VSALELVLSRLEGVKKDGRGWKARCPAHEDRKPSLSVSEGDEGKVLLHCHTGCNPADIVAAMGLTMGDLFNGNGKSGKPEIVATYAYTDADGKLLYQVVRVSPKDFRQRRPDGNGGWVWKLGDAPRVLYRLVEVVAAVSRGDIIYVCEGEKDADAIVAAGAIATCNAGGAGKWRDEYSQALMDAKVVIVADKDVPGRKHAEAVRVSLARHGVEARVVEAAEGKDAADHLAAGKGLEDFVEAEPVDVEPAPVDMAATQADTELPPDEGCTDTGNANRFIRLFGDRVRFCALETQWRVYDGVRWGVDERLVTQELVRQAMISILEDAATATDDGEAKRMAKWGAHSLSAAARKAALECARSDPRVAVHPADFDRDGMLLNALNGTIDLHTGELRPHDPNDLITKLAPVEYDPDAHSELWERVLGLATGSDKDYLGHLQRSLGYATTASTAEEVVFNAVGPTETVKSTVVGAVRKAMGDYAADVQPETFLRGRGVGSTRDDLIRLEHVRLAIVPEADRGTRMHEGLLKAWVSGETITVRGVYQRDREIRPTAKLCYHTNFLPRMSDDDDAVWRRVVIWPFDHRPEEPDPQVKAELHDPAKSGAAILAWLVEGCLAWQRHGLGTPPLVHEATRGMRLSMDPLSDFFDECCVFEDTWTPNRQIQSAYETWAREYRRSKVSAKEMAKRLRARDCEPSSRNGSRGWSGISIAAAEAVEQALSNGCDGDSPAWSDGS